MKPHFFISMFPSSEYSQYGQLVELEGREYLLLRWSDIRKMVPLLVDYVEKNYSPTKYIGVLRGGCTLTHLITDYTDNHNMRAIRAELWDRIEGRMPNSSDLRITQGLSNESLENDDVLIVEEVADTGITLEGIRLEISPRKPRNCKTATFYKKSHSRFTPDFYLFDIPGKIWIGFPWELYEITADALKELLRIGYDKQEARSIIAGNFEYLFDGLSGDDVINRADELLERSSIPKASSP